MQTPIIGLAPMDGVTDAAFRYMTDTYSKPDVLYTEFTSVEGITQGAVKLLNAFIYHATNTPIIAQFFGSHPDDFYQASFVACEMGFDGIDINMGCPDEHIARKGGGAALILKPKLAQDIIAKVKKAADDFTNGKTIEQTSLPPSIIDTVHAFKKTSWVKKPKKTTLPVSVKTRIGYDNIVTEEWISSLLESEPAAIAIHGRTLRQMYTGEANWKEIGKAAELIRKTKTLVLGNGDIKTMSDARKKIADYKLDGVLVGRATLGNPWFFKDYIPSEQERKQAALEHCKAYLTLTPQLNFLAMRKHLGWYMKGIHKSHELRNRLMQIKTLADVQSILSEPSASLY